MSISSICLLVIASLNLALSRIGPSHWLPEQRMRDAISLGDQCILWLGDSRMDAGYDAGAFRTALRRSGFDRCSIDLAIGGTDISGTAFIMREYLRRGGRPSMVLIGMVGDSLLGPEPQLDPGDMVGNNAVHLVWSDVGDVFDESPGFPWRNVASFDRGLRFLTSRTLALGRFQSLISLKVQRIQDAFVGGDEKVHNRWGLADDMDRLAEDLRTRAHQRIQTLPADARMGRWFPKIAVLAAEAGATLVLVNLPMPSQHAPEAADTEDRAYYDKWLFASAEATHSHVIDLRHEPWLDDSLFADPLHLNARGATLLSNTLGERLASLSRRAP